MSADWEVVDDDDRSFDRDEGPGRRASVEESWWAADGMRAMSGDEDIDPAGDYYDALEAEAEVEAVDDLVSEGVDEDDAAEAVFQDGADAADWELLDSLHVVDERIAELGEDYPGAISQGMELGLEGDDLLAWIETMRDSHYSKSEMEDLHWKFNPNANGGWRFNSWGGDYVSY